MGWDEQQGRVSRAFNDWHLIDQDQRTFLQIGLQFAREKYDEVWEQASHESGDPDGPELVDVFDDRIGGLWPHDYEWMHLAGVLRDSVTNFEVYLEKASSQVLSSHGFAWGDSPRWGDLKRFAKALGLVLESDGVREVRDLRHFLTHQRGELRTEDQRRKFAQASTDIIPPIVVELDEESVLTAMDKLARSVRSIDPAIWAHTFGGRRLTNLERALTG